MSPDVRARRLKRTIRRSTVASILGLDPARRALEEGRLKSRFRELPGFAAAETVLLYVNTFPEELDTRDFFAEALAAGKRVVCPRVDRTAPGLRLFHITSLATDLEPGVLGIPEPKLSCAEVSPEAVDWALVPGLTFDRACYRLGRGGGYYDRLLPRLRPDCPRWSLAFDCQLIDHLPIEPHDMPVDGVAFPSQVHTRA